MTGTNVIHKDSIRVHESRARPTPPPAGRQFRDTLAHAAGRVLRGVDAISPLVPGGAIVGLAARSAPRANPSEALGAGAAPSDAGALGGLGGSDDALKLLALQRDIGLEQQRYSALSNVLKARHETARAVIQNVR